MSTYQERLSFALGVSLLLHLAALWFYASPMITRAISQLLASVVSPKPAVVVTKQDQERMLARRKQVPLLSFVEVDASQASAIRPPDARFYSDRSSLAANPTPMARSVEVPKIEGRKLNHLETTTVRLPGRAQPTPARVASSKLQPFDLVMRVKLSKIVQKPKEDGVTSPELALREQQPDPAVSVAQPVPAQQAASAPVPHLQLAEPSFSLRSEPRPGEASEREIPTIASQTDAGVSRRGPVALNVVGMPQGAYSKKMFAEIGRRWTLLLEQYYADGQPGTVKINFTLYPTGRVANLRIAQNTASSILGSYCEKAVVDSSPFDRWPEELKLLGGDHLDITIDFNVYLYER